MAKRLGWEWVDADTELERRTRQTIREIFQTQGEPGFRKLERELLAELLRRDKWVISAGGGAILNPETAAEMRSSGWVVWLHADAATLHSRINADISTAERRPNLLSGGLDEIERMLAIREPLYRSTAHILVNTANRTLDEIAAEVYRQLPPEMTSAERSEPTTGPDTPSPRRLDLPSPQRLESPS
jgi:shikimate kinase